MSKSKRKILQRQEISERLRLFIEKWLSYGVIRDYAVLMGYYKDLSYQISAKSDVSNISVGQRSVDRSDGSQVIKSMPVAPK